MPDGDGHKLHSPSVFLEGRDEGMVLLGLLRVCLVASEVSGEPNLNENEGAQLFVEVGASVVRCVRDSSGVDEVRGCAVTSLEESQGFLRG